MQTVLLLGAGGAGCAVGHALVESGIGHLVICDNNRRAAVELAKRIETGSAPTTVDVCKSADKAEPRFDGVVNATPVGMASHPGMPIDVALLEHRPWVADIVYFPLETELLRTARTMGCRTMSGRSMAIMQAAKSFHLFTGLEADARRMGAVFDQLGALDEEQ